MVYVSLLFQHVCLANIVYALDPLSQHSDQSLYVNDKMMIFFFILPKNDL